MAELRIRTNIYAGPLDLLLWLVRKSEVDIHDLPVGEIAEQYIAELEKMDRVDLAFAGEYLVLAAQLLKVKSELVLHFASKASEKDDPRTSLVRQLLEYKKYRDAAFLLSEYHEDELRRHPRPVGMIPRQEVDDVFLEEVTVYDLWRHSTRLLREVTQGTPHAVLLDDVPIEEYIRRILAQLMKTGAVDFDQLFASEPTRQAKIGNFLAVLELVKSQQVDVDADEEGFRILPKGRGSEPKVEIE